jgi:hypothetical protein
MEFSMGEVLVSLLPYIIGSALVPVYLMITILLLKSPRQGLTKGVAYVAGITTTRLLQGLLFGLIFTESIAVEEGGSKSPVISTLLLVLGLLLLIAAYKKWRREDDPDDPPPRWLTLLDGISPLKAFGLGVLLPLIGAKLWVFTLSTLAVITAAPLEPPAGAIAYLLFVVLAQSLLLLLIVIRILMPARSQSMLDGLSAWLTKNNRAVVIIVSLIFGLFFLYSGISGLLA